MKTFKIVIQENKALVFVLFAYFIAWVSGFGQPIFRHVFEDNPDVSFFWPWFLFQFGITTWLFVVVYRAPFFYDYHGFLLRKLILISILIRLVFIVCVLSGVYYTGELKPNLRWLWFFFNKGELGVPFLGPFSVPVLMAYLEIFFLGKYFSVRARSVVDRRNRKRFSISSFIQHLNDADVLRKSG